MSRLVSILFLVIAINSTYAWKPAGQKIKTVWADSITPENVWQTYPRPQLKRTDWQNLNGLWKYAVTDKTADKKSVVFNDEILVPFAIESSLSGVQKEFTPNEKLWYKRSFTLDAKNKGKQTILHFQAVDYACEVWVNNKLAGSHTGGNIPFSFNITNLLSKGGVQILELAVTDPTDTESISRGKQQLKQQGIWYTPVSGIWQTVWLESVEKTHISGVFPITDIHTNTVNLQVGVQNPTGNETVKIKVFNKNNQITTFTSKLTEQLKFSIPNAKHWTPETPELYHVELEMYSSNRLLDKVQSYFAFREVKKEKDALGYNRVFLNGKPVFQYGTLDQGWWPDGLLTPPSSEALLWDMVKTKEMGFNTIRKHIKIEPALFYYYADSLGLMIWQDMPSGFATARKETEHIKASDKNDWDAPENVSKRWRIEYREMIDYLKFFPSITTWIVFNEGWGQHNTVENVKWAKSLDNSRITNGVTGWTDRKAGDMYDIHNYPSTSMIKPQFNDNRISALGEFGGIGLPVKEHLWRPDMRNWGYKNIDGGVDFANDYSRLMFDLESLIPQGLAAAIYTQTTDVEGEVNGFFTYDRKVQKLPSEYLNIIHSRLYNLNSAKVTTLIDDSQGGDSVMKTVELNGLVKTLKFPYRLENNKTVTISNSFKCSSQFNSLSLWLYLNGKVTIILNNKVVFKNEVRIARHFNQYNLSNFAKYITIGENQISFIIEPFGKNTIIDFGLSAF